MSHILYKFSVSTIPSAIFFNSSSLEHEKYIHMSNVSENSSCSRAQNNALENNERGIEPEATANETFNNIAEK